MLIASYYFYFCWEPLYTIILAISTLIDHYCALGIGKSQQIKNRRNYFFLSLFSNIGSLFLFKYSDQFIATLKTLFQPLQILTDLSGLSIIAPIGISFYIFKKISYILDVFWKKQEPEKNLGKFALYVSFFPEIIAGPIDRANSLLPQFDQVHSFDYDRITGGLKRIAWGIFKKIAIADRLGVLVKIVFDHPRDCNWISLLAAVFFFSIQIYSDFSGYTDMVLGMSQIFGYRLSENFNRPYLAASIGEFWNRWHISLTTWLRDYLFFPVTSAISRKIKKERWLKIKAEAWSYVFGISVTMLLCGVWHGAGWNFLVWGGLHAFYLIFSFGTRKVRAKWRKNLFRALPSLKVAYKGIRILITFFAVSYLWIFFRADSLSDAFYIASHLFMVGLSPGNTFANMETEMILAFVAIGVMIFSHFLQPHEGMHAMLATKPMLIRWFFYVLLILAIMNLGKFHEAPFIYVQF